MLVLDESAVENFLEQALLSDAQRLFALIIAFC
jgi:hypothetical protein